MPIIWRAVSSTGLFEALRALCPGPDAGTESTRDAPVWSACGGAQEHAPREMASRTGSPSRKILAGMAVALPALLGLQVEVSGLQVIGDDSCGIHVIDRFTSLETPGLGICVALHADIGIDVDMLQYELTV